MKSLTYQGEQGDAVALSKTGIPFYDGSAMMFDEWKFRVSAKKAALEGKEAAEKKQGLMDLAARILDGLSGDAFSAATDIGIEKLVSEEGVDLLVERIRQGLTGKKILEAKDLYKEGLRDDGILVWSIGESMASYGTRRIRWARKLKELDSDYAFSEQVQADMILEHSRLTEAQR